MGSIPLLAYGLILSGCDKKESANHEAKEKSESTHEAKEAQPKAEVSAALSKGIGPVKSLEVGALDMALVAKGEKTFSGTCSACHKLDKRYVGPALSGVTKRRTPEWIMNMMLNPTEMTQNDPTAKALLGEYMTQMSVIIAQDDARAVLEYFRSKDGI